MGPYCNYCGRRCFLPRVIPDGPRKGESLILATCGAGMARDVEATGHTHETALNPVTQEAEVEALAASGHAPSPEPKQPGAYRVEGKDGFDLDADYYSLADGLTYSEAKHVASVRLQYLNETQPDAGGPAGIQDRVYVVHPDGRREQVFS